MMMCQTKLIEDLIEDNQVLSAKNNKIDRVKSPSPWKTEKIIYNLKELLMQQKNQGKGFRPKITFQKQDQKNL